MTNKINLYTLPLKDESSFCSYRLCQWPFWLVVVMYGGKDQTITKWILWLDSLYVFQTLRKKP